VLGSNYNLAATGSSRTAVALSIELCYKRVCPGISFEAAALRLPRTTGRLRLLSLLSLPVQDLSKLHLRACHPTGVSH
jgi:hypothetical protein